MLHGAHDARKNSLLVLNLVQWVVLAVAVEVLTAHTTHHPRCYGTQCRRAAVSSCRSLVKVRPR